MDRNKPFGKIRVNFDILSNPSERRRKKMEIEALLKEVENNPYVSFRITPLSRNSFPLRIAVIDFECEPPKFLGILISNRIYQIYCISEAGSMKFYQMILKLLAIVKEWFLFSFSSHEARFILKILPYKVQKCETKPSTTFLKNLNIINVQIREDEGLVPALYSIGQTTYNDPLLRNNTNVDLHYKEGHFNLILEHNKSCLLSTLKLVKFRFLKVNLI